MAYTAWLGGHGHGPKFYLLGSLMIVYAMTWLVREIRRPDGQAGTPRDLLPVQGSDSMERLPAGRA